MHPVQEHYQHLNRRYFFQRSGVGMAALASLFASDASAAKKEPVRNSIGGLSDLPHFPAKAKRVIYLFQSGGPSQIDLLDYKPQLQDKFGTDVPESVYPARSQDNDDVGPVQLPDRSQRVQIPSARRKRPVDERTPASNGSGR